jgi:hypothetical protein
VFRPAHPHLAVLLCVLCGVSHCAWADEGDEGPTIYGDRHGYTTDIGFERNSRSHEMVMLRKPDAGDKPLAEVIFDEKLSREFQQQYANKFGTTQAEQVINSPGRYDAYTYNTGRNATLQDYRRDQRKFGEYMARRLLEYHVDQYAKRDKGFRQVYEIKDRVSNVEVKSKNGWNVKWKYNISGPTMDFEVRNPYEIEMRARVEMNALISSPTEVIYRLGYQLTPRVRLSEMIKQIDGIFQTILSRRMTAHIGMSLSVSFDTSPLGPSIQQDTYLVGFSWSE